MITSDAAELQAIRQAVHDAELIVVSDWSQYTSFEYMDAMKQTGYDILYGFSPLLRSKKLLKVKRKATTVTNMTVKLLR